MRTQISTRKIILAMAGGLIGCIFMGGSDWLMIYGNTAYEGELAWLTLGVAGIEPWRNALAMAFAFPAIIFYSIGLFGMGEFFRDKGDRKKYSYLTALGLTPWLCLHLFYIMILYVFGWLQRNGHVELSYEVGETLFGHLSWVVIVSEVLMVLPFIYLFYVLISQRTVFSKWMAFNNPLVFYIILKGITMLMSDKPYRLAFVNGLMSESMAIVFILFMIGTTRMKKYRL